MTRSTKNASSPLWTPWDINGRAWIVGIVSLWLVTSTAQASGATGLARWTFIVAAAATVMTLVVYGGDALRARRWGAVLIAAWIVAYGARQIDDGEGLSIVISLTAFWLITAAGAAYFLAGWVRGRSGGPGTPGERSARD